MQVCRHGRIGSRTGAGALVVALAVLALAFPVRAEVLQYGDGVADGKKSIGGGGHLTLFDAGREGRWLNKVEMFGSRYGYPQPPDEDFYLYVVDTNGGILRRVALPYSLWARGDEYWRDLPIPPIQVPKGFGIGLTFNAEQTKGVYVGTDAVPISYSYSWLPGQQGQPLQGADWMIRVTVEDQAAGDPEARDLVVLKSGEAFFDRFLGTEGNPLTVKTAQHGSLPKDQVASIRLGAITSPAPVSAVVTLTSGAKVACDILSANENALRIRDDTGAERDVARSEVARIEFK